MSNSIAPHEEVPKVSETPLARGPSVRQRSRALALPGLVAVVLVLTAALVTHAPTALSQPHKKGATSADLGKHAGAAHADALSRFKSGMGSAEQVYTWSVRWLDADLRGATSSKAKKQAYTDHQTRMGDLRTQVMNQVSIGAASAGAEHGAHYFAAQAALWRAKLARD